MPPEIPAVLFNYDLAMVGSDLSVIDPKIDDIIGCIVKGLPKSWAPKNNWKIGPLPGEPSTYTVTGADYETAYNNLQNLYMQKYISDGLPIAPPTAARVSWLMTGTTHQLTDIVGADQTPPLSGQIETRLGILTYQMLAIQMAMAGGRPEYMSVAAPAMMNGMDTSVPNFESSASASPMIIVNGSVGDDIRLNNGFGLVGPDVKWPAGRMIARATWLVRQNIGNMLEGKGTIGVFGDVRPGWCWTENEAGLPTGWTTFAKDYYGRAAGTQSVTSGKIFGGGFRSLPVRGAYTDPVLKSIQDPIDQAAIALTDRPFGVAAAGKGAACLLLIPGQILRFFDEYGWHKEILRGQYASGQFYCLNDVAQFSGVQAAYAAAGKDITKEDMLKKYALCTDPTNMRIICCGGDHLVGLYVKGFQSFGNTLITKPHNWSDLLAAAVKDLGPMPSVGGYSNDL